MVTIESVEAVHAALAEHNYLADEGLSTAVFLAHGATFVVLFSLHQGVTAEQILPLARAVAAAL